MKRRVLVADDSATIQKVIRIAFAKIDVEVAAAASIFETSTDVQRQRPDLIIADAGLPGNKGPQDFVKLATAAAAPIVMLVGSYETIDEGALRSAGLNRILRKPFDVQDLLSLCREILEPGAGLPTAPGAPAFGDVGTGAGFRQMPTSDTTSGFSLVMPGAAQPGAGAFQPPQHIPPVPSISMNPRPAGMPNPTIPPPPNLAAPNPPTPAPPAPEKAMSALRIAVTSGGLPPDLENFDSNPVPPAPQVDSARRGRPAFPEGGTQGTAGNKSMPGAPQSPSQNLSFDDDVSFSFGAGTPSTHSNSFSLDENPPSPKIPGASGMQQGNQPQVPIAPINPVSAKHSGVELSEQELARLVRERVEDYCQRNFGNLAREVIANELRRLAEERARLLVDQ